jgi:hypothetical protein
MYFANMVALAKKDANQVIEEEIEFDFQNSTLNQNGTRNTITPSSFIILFSSKLIFIILI